MSPVTASDDDGSTWPTGCVAADSSTPGADGYTASAPCKIDASGTDQDQFCIPMDFFQHPVYGFGGYKLDDEVQVEGCHSTSGNVSVTITTSYNSGTWTFDYNDQQTGTEAANIYRLRVAKACTRNRYTGDRYRRVWAYVTNVADITVRSFSAFPEVRHVRDWYSIIDTDHASNILDGDTATMRVREYVDNGILGLRPGRYTVTFWLSDTGFADTGKDVAMKHQKLFVRRCAGQRR
jgi:hypothetical protein